MKDIKFVTDAEVTILRDLVVEKLRDKLISQSSHDQLTKLYRKLYDNVRVVGSLTQRGYTK